MELARRRPAHTTQTSPVAAPGQRLPPPQISTGLDQGQPPPLLLPLPEADRELHVRHRMQRRAILERPAPIPYRAVIHEAALRIRVGGRATSLTQLARILELSEADHITVRIIPFTLERFDDTGSAMIYAGGDIPELDTVVRDAPHGTAFIDAEAQLGLFRTLFRRVEASSLDPEQTRDLIHNLAKEL